MFKLNEVIDNQYIVDYKIGSGSFGSIFLAWDKVNKKKVALKVEPTNVSFPLVIYEANVTVLMAE